MTKKIPNIVVLTGAGISAESGIPTFRASDGLWAEYNIEDVATPEGFERDPFLVNEFYNKRRKELLKVEANEAHKALVHLADAYAGHFVLITQNIDDLHERAGLTNVFHMHGELLKVRCTECETIVDHSTDALDKHFCTTCNKDVLMRPHVVWFGEYPIGMDLLYQFLDKTDIFIAIGTAGNVYPAAGFVKQVKQNKRNARTIDVNLAPSPAFKEVLQGQATLAVPKLVDALIAALKEE